MKKVIGTVKHKPIVTGDPNLVTENEIFWEENNDKITLKKRSDSQELKSITGGSGDSEGSFDNSESGEVKFLNRNNTSYNTPLDINNIADVIDFYKQYDKPLLYYGTRDFNASINNQRLFVSDSDYCVQIYNSDNFDDFCNGAYLNEFQTSLLYDGNVVSVWLGYMGDYYYQSIIIGENNPEAIDDNGNYSNLMICPCSPSAFKAYKLDEQYIDHCGYYKLIFIDNIDDDYWKSSEFFSEYINFNKVKNSEDVVFSIYKESINDTYGYAIPITGISTNTRYLNFGVELKNLNVGKDLMAWSVKNNAMIKLLDGYYN